MNARHAIALLLFAVGGFLVLVGGIVGGTGLAGMAQARDRAGLEAGTAFAEIGGLALAAGVAALAFGVRLYRRGDHRMRPADPAVGKARARFPLLSPVIGILLVLTTVLLAVSVAEYGFNWKNPRAVRALAGWAVLTAAFLTAAGQALIRRWRRAPPKPATDAPAIPGPAEQPAGSQNGSSP